MCSSRRGGRPPGLSGFCVADTPHLTLHAGPAILSTDCPPHESWDSGLPEEIWKNMSPGNTGIRGVWSHESAKPSAPVPRCPWWIVPFKGSEKSCSKIEYLSAFLTQDFAVPFI